MFSFNLYNSEYHVTHLWKKKKSCHLFCLRNYRKYSECAEIAKVNQFYLYINNYFFCEIIDLETTFFPLIAPIYFVHD